MNTLPPPRNENDRRLTGRAQLALWVATAVVAVGVLAAVVAWERPHRLPLAGIERQGDPRLGEAIFHAKRCAHCHAVNGVGGSSAPDLARSRHLATDRLLMVMWNHAPEMWRRAQIEQVDLPELTREEAAHLSAYLESLPRTPPPAPR